MRARDLICDIPVASEPLFSKECNQVDAFAAESTFVDDLAAPTMCYHTEQDEIHVVLLAEAVYLITAKYGFALNFGPTKTAVLVSLRGEGRKAALERLSAAKEAKFWLPQAQVSPLPNTYKYLRGIVHRGGLLAPEVAYRRTSQKQAIGPLQRSVYKRWLLPTKFKFKWTDSLCSSQLLFNAWTWPSIADTT